MYKLQDKNDYPVRNPTCGSAVAFTTFPAFTSFSKYRKGT